MNPVDLQRKGWKPAIEGDGLDYDGLTMPQSGRWVVGRDMHGGNFVCMRQVWSWNKIVKWRNKRSWLTDHDILTHWRHLTARERLRYGVNDEPSIPWSLVSEVDGVLMFKKVDEFAASVSSQNGESK